MLTVGDTYRKIIADENCLVRVERIDGPYVLGVVVDEPITLPTGATISSDHAGQEVSDLVDSVKRIVAHQDAIERAVHAHHSDNEDFWASVPEGTVLHYRDIADQFYRGVSIPAEDGLRSLKVTALVGGWPSYVRPYWNEYGEKSVNHPASQAVLEGKVMRPNASCVFESPSYRALGPSHDPRQWEEIDFSIQGMTEEDEEQAALARLVRDVCDASMDTTALYSERLDRIRKMLRTN